jgi:type II secretory pathway pseudopilin PulG
MTDAFTSLLLVDVLAVSAETTDRLITVASVVAGAIIGGLITVFVTWLQNRYARSERKAEARVARRARAAAVLGRARTFLTDITPERIGFNVDPEATPEQSRP